MQNFGLGAAGVAIGTLVAGARGRGRIYDPEDDKRNQEDDRRNQKVWVGAAVGGVAAMGGVALNAQFRNAARATDGKVRLPDYQCKHLCYCDHSEIKASLISLGTNKAKACSSVRTAINTVANIFAFD